jgi:non-ribosomal peptide synthetase component F
MELWVRLESALVRRGDRTSVVQLTNDSTCLPKLWTARQLLDLINFYERKIQSELAKQSDNAAKPHVIAICLSNSVAYIAAAVAALKAGAIFLPIDPRWPEPRIEEALTHANAVLWLWMEPEVPGGHGLTLPTSMTNDPRCCAMQLASPDAVLCDQLHFEKDVCCSNHINNDNVSNKLKDPGYVYIMFTSGSTGHPLRVYGSAKGIVNRCDWMAENYPWDDLDLVCFKTAPCFVDSIWEMFGPLLGGVRLLAAPLPMATDPYLLGKVIYNHGVTHITCVPSFWTRLLCAFEPSDEAPELPGDLHNRGFLKLRQVVSSGETLCGALLHRLQNTLPQGCRILNIYGSTETAADASCFDCSASTGLSFESHAFVPVGIPLPGFIIACIDEISPGMSSNPSEVNLLPFGEEGEVVVGNLFTELAATIYHSNQCATSLSFIDVTVKKFHELNSLTNWSALPASSWEDYRAKKVSLQMVRMGDLGCIQNGVLTLRGRTGDRIKVSGRDNFVLC